MKIEKAKLIGVEGKDEKHFFEAFLKHLGIADMQVEEFQGKNQFRVNVENLTLLPGFSKIEKLILIRDADFSPKGKSNSSEDAFKSMQNVLKNAQLPIPQKQQIFTPIENGKPQTAIYIMPFAEIEGMFEDFLWASIAEDKQDCIASFFECIDTQIEQHKLPKAKLQVYLAAQTEPKRDFIGSMTDSTNYWNFDHEKFAELKTMLTDI